MRQVVLLVLDGLPLDRVGSGVMPTLSALGPVAGRGVLCSSTYPNHATFVTGVAPPVHGITANWVVRDGDWLQAHEVGPAVPTLFDRCAAAGLTSAAVFGDHHLVGVTGAAAATSHWPPGGEWPAGTALDGSGYATDEAVLPHLLAAVRSEAHLVVAQLNGGDTAGHESGPSSAEAAEAYSSYDRCLRAVLDAAGGDAVVCVVSDHGQVDGVAGPAVDVWSSAPAGLAIVPEGDAVLLLGEDPEGGRWLDAVPGVVGHEPYGDGRIAWSEPGRLFGHGEAAIAGVHGGPATLTQVNAVRGAALPADGLHGTDWAPSIAALLHLAAPDLPGRSRLS